MPEVLLFAAAREAAGTARAEAQPGPLSSVLDELVTRYGSEFERVLNYCSVVVDERVVRLPELEGVLVEDTSEVAILPPVSGGEEAPAMARMIDVGDKDETRRSATARCRLTTRPDVRELIVAGQLRKGDALATATVAGILAAKKVPDLIPLCHPVRTTGVDVTFEADAEDGILVQARVTGRDRTGFEMEALAAASTAALTIYDMAKGDDPEMTIDGLRVIEKTGGVTGDWRLGR
jgi:cyclic pyranopterin monophosphate synthase